MSTKSTDGISRNNILGVVAGEGTLPGLLARSARDKGFKVIALALSETAGERIAEFADKVYQVSPGQIGKSMNLFKQENVQSAVFIGKVPKINLLTNIFKLDWVAVKELSKLSDFSDDSIQFAVGNLAEANGVKVLTQSEFLRHLFPEVGVIGKRIPSAAEYVDIQYGLRIAKELARLDIGQTVIVKNQMILAVEAIEGTDEAIRRAVKLAKGPVVVVKVSKPNQDQRFDIPTVGMNTLTAMRAEKLGGVLAIEANETMVIEKAEIIAFAEQHGIAVVAV